jgi:translocation and assembly module TamB
MSARGKAAVTGGQADTSWLDGLSGLAENTVSTPVGPVMAQLAPSLGAVFRSFSASLNFDAASGQKEPSNAVISGLRLASASGARLEQTAPLEIRNGTLKGAVRMALGGGGLPVGNLVLIPQGNGWSGTLALSPYAAKGGSLSLPKLAFSGGPGGNWRFDGQATLSGPLIGGYIDGLSVPVDGQWRGGQFLMLQDCRDIRFKAFRTASFSLPGRSFRACPDGGAILQAGKGGTRLAFTSPSLSGNAFIGSTPVRYEGSQIRFSIDRGFIARNVAVDLGSGETITKLTMASIDGRFVDDGMRGTIENGHGTIGSVPLLAENAKGDWSYIRSVLALDAVLTVSDAEQVDRFKTLNVPDLALTLEDGLITAIGHLDEPTTGIRVADVDIEHRLTAGTGRALLAVDKLTFTERFQPEMLTPLTLGAVSYVDGSISGDGRIEWDPAGVRSSGLFSTSKMDFAAAFGPVTGLSTDVAFTDLLGLETAPSQLAKIAVVNPGIPTFNGQLRYQLLPDQKVRIEEGRWPFYGGELILEPTTLDFDLAVQRHLTFRMVGLDAEKFLAGYDLENLRVSGVFDGTLPMVFDQDGGRIVGGWLVSRKGGGELSYLGELSYEDMGVFANFAFQALRSIRFEEMQIGVEGNIAGEVVTEVRFRGLQQGSGAKRNFITKQLAKLPLEFNVRIEAEFLSLIGSLRALYDGEYAAQRYKSYIENQQPVAGE